MPRRQAMEAIFFVLQTGCKWKTLPREFGAPSTVYGHFQEWQRADVFTRLVDLGILPLPGHVELRRRQRGRAKRVPTHAEAPQSETDSPLLTQFVPVLSTRHPEFV
jgi:transposase